MPKSKKLKTNNHANHQPYSTRRNHRSMNDGNMALSHEEIWDDSALLRSWDDAVKEYEFYHSIHARGEDIDEVLRRAEAAEEAERADRLGPTSTISTAYPPTESHTESPAEPPPHPNDRNTSSSEDGEIEEDGEVNEHRDIFATNRPPETSAPLHLSANRTAEETSATAPTTTMIATTEEDQTLENVKMAYYWAGYYSGLYDGQKQGLGQKQKQNQ